MVGQLGAPLHSLSRLGTGHDGRRGSLSLVLYRLRRTTSCHPTISREPSGHQTPTLPEEEKDKGVLSFGHMHGGGGGRVNARLACIMIGYSS